MRTDVGVALVVVSGAMGCLAGVTVAELALHRHRHRALRELEAKTAELGELAEKLRQARPVHPAARPARPDPTSPSWSTAEEVSARISAIWPAARPGAPMSEADRDAQRETHRWWCDYHERVEAAPDSPLPDWLRLKAIVRGVTREDRAQRALLHSWGVELSPGVRGWEMLDKRERGRAWTSATWADHRRAVWDADAAALGDAAAHAEP